MDAQPLVDQWKKSAEAWISAQGEHGDWARRWVLDPVMSRIILSSFPGYTSPLSLLDCGCGDGRFCRLLDALVTRDGHIGPPIHFTGIDPVDTFINIAREKHPAGRYDVGCAEALPYSDGSFDVVVAYLSLLDFANFDCAMNEVVRVGDSSSVTL
eukprot:gnl/Spiro4/29450_TR14425_c0_g1_i2.p2 gnl/Spiro4/29450_TR14425_c0_g1~~gnl/Spiro4/29450_TR14425_c0_g1_i2.p2  ORF type:complete len:164 (-),score=38.46 gnl/Spiro4/29450_TR14425_c0_g1_i2:486-950(-)